MSNDQDLFGEINKTSTMEPNPKSDSETSDLDDILELTDVVREGKDPLELDADAPLLLDVEKLDLQEAAVTEDPGDEDIPSVMPEEAEDGTGAEEPDVENDFSALESSDFKFEDNTPLETADTEPFPEQTHRNNWKMFWRALSRKRPFSKGRKTFWPSSKRTNLKRRG